MDFIRGEDEVVGFVKFRFRHDRPGNAVFKVSSLAAGGT